jgi:hypothetical protein
MKFTYFIDKWQKAKESRGKMQSSVIDCEAAGYHFSSQIEVCK